MAADLQFRLTGGASNSDPDASLGGVMSSNQVSATALNNLFDDVEPDEASAGDTEYRAIDVYNNGDETAEEVGIYIKTETGSSDSQLDLGLDSTTQTIGNEDTAPSSVTFTHNLVGNKLAISNISSGSAQRVWLRRTISASAGNKASDLGAIAVTFA